MNKTKFLRILLFLLPAVIWLSACQDELNTIGSSLDRGEVTIIVDSMPTKIASTSVYEPIFDARTATKLLGRISVPEYGDLKCSFVTRLMSAVNLTIPDSITINKIDSMTLVLSVPRATISGDSLAPQQLKVFRLTKALPADINNEFDPEGYYDPSAPLGVKSYTISGLTVTDSTYKSTSDVKVRVNMPLDLAREFVTAYRTTPEIFRWPDTFANYFQGLYIEQNFGNGCVAAISNLELLTYWNRIDKEYVIDKDTPANSGYKDVIKRDSICLFSYQPEVLSSNNVTYTVSEKINNLVDEGKVVITTPGGYYADFTFPAQDIIDKYKNQQANMSVISKLALEIPANTIKNNYGISYVPTLLMVKKSERENFFKENKVPDYKTSFYARYNSSTGRYSFTALRDYLLSLLEKDEITDDDVEFSLVPVLVNTEEVTGYNSSTSFVIRCAPYVLRPTMTVLNMDEAIICFTFSKQVID